MLEEIEGWIPGEAQRHVVEMADAVIEVMVEASQQIQGEDRNPFKGQCSEIRPINLERNFSGFMMRKGAIKFNDTMELLVVRIAL